MIDYNRISIDLHSWLKLPKRGYSAVLTREGLDLVIESFDYSFHIEVRMPVPNWRRSVAQHLAYLRTHVRQQARQWRERAESRLTVVS